MRLDNMSPPEVIINIRHGAPSKAQMKAWDELMEMLIERAEALQSKKSLKERTGRK